MIVQEKTFEKAKKGINEISKTNPQEPIVFTSEDDDLNRKVIEKIPITCLLLSQGKKKDFQKQRNSGFNHVLAEIARKNKITIGINLDEIIESPRKEKAEILARIQQNIFLCNKKKIQMKFIAQNPKNQRNIYDLKSLGLILGMPTWMTKSL